MSEALKSLEDKLSAVFEAADWSLDESTLTEVEVQSDGVEIVNMDMGDLLGSRPVTN